MPQNQLAALQRIAFDTVLARIWAYDLALGRGTAASAKSPLSSRFTMLITAGTVGIVTNAVQLCMFRQPSDF